MIIVQLACINLVYWTKRNFHSVSLMLSPIIKFHKRTIIQLSVCANMQAGLEKHSLTLYDGDKTCSFGNYNIFALIQSREERTHTNSLSKSICLSYSRMLHLRTFHFTGVVHVFFFLAFGEMFLFPLVQNRNTWHLFRVFADMTI